MAIIFPKNCRNVTAGALRQLKQHGITAASGGLITEDALVAFIGVDTASFSNPWEPLGAFMRNIEDARNDLEKTSAAVLEAGRRLSAASGETAAQIADASRKMREATDKLSAQMQKFYSIFANSKFDEQARAAQSLADAMERLAALESKGVLSKVMAALQK